MAVTGLLAASWQAASSQARAGHESTPSPVAGPLSLEDVVQRALLDNPDVRISAQAVNVALGLATSAHAVYDPAVQTSVVHGREYGLRVVTPTTAGVDPTIVSELMSSVTSSASAQQYLQWGGILLTPQLSVTTAGSPGAFAQSRATTWLGVAVPLSRDRGGGLSRSLQDAAYAEVDAARYDLRQAAAAGVYQAVTAYWSYLGARRRLEVLVVAEDRATRNLTQTVALVAADERPAADLVPLRGNVASKTVTRIAAEQAVLEAWKVLAGLLGVGDVDIATTPNVSTDFPAFPPSSALQRQLIPTDMQALVDAALGRRADFAAAVARTQELELSTRATDHLRRPVIDIVAQVGYSGLSQGWGVQRFVDPLYRARSPLNASVQLNYQFSVLNAGASGRALQISAGLEQQREARGAMERSIRTGVVVSIAGLRRSIAAGEAAHLSTLAAQQSVENELQKFRLGSSTAFDVILAEDNLTNASLGDVAGRQGYAVALARTQFELGTLLGAEHRALTVNLTGLLHAPSLVVTP